MPRYACLYTALLDLQIGASTETLAQGAPTVVSFGTCRLTNGAAIPDCRIAYRAFGHLNAARTPCSSSPGSSVARRSGFLCWGRTATSTPPGSIRSSDSWFLPPTTGAEPCQSPHPPSPDRRPAS